MSDVEVKEVDWHSLTVDEVFSKLDTSKKGLSSKEAEKRLDKYGLNEIVEEGGLSPLKIFLYQFKNVMTLILSIAIIISFLINELIDAAVILVILVINVFLGFFQEYKAEKAMEALKSLASPKAIVLRVGEEKVIKSRQLVPGDVVVLEVGDIVPANTRLFETVNFKVDQAHLTGESVPVLKDTDKLPSDTHVTDRSNMAFMGSTVTYGRARGIVTQTGMKTEVGAIARTVASEEREVAPLREEVDKLGKGLAVFALIAVVLVFIIGLLTGLEFFEIFLTSVSLAVSAVPEGLPAVITVTLALGMRKMASKKAIVRKLSAVQSLGSVTTICSDKTGTLTKNEMTVTKLFDGVNEYKITGAGYKPEGDFLKNDEKINPLKNKQLKKILITGALCNNAYFGKDEGQYQVVGDPTEGCLLVAAAKANLWYEDLKSERKEVAEISFTSERRRMSVVYSSKEGRFVHSKGAPDAILKLCNRVQKGDGVGKLTSKKKKELIKKTESMASNGLRVLAVAYKKFNSKSTNEKKVESDLVFLGLVGMIDPPREEVGDAIKLAQKAGIRVVVITGDHELTAKAVASDIGLMTEKSVSFSGGDIEKMSDKEFSKAAANAAIFSRVSPQHKVRIVEELKKQGEIIAVTGDGVNDAPALKKAHVGVAMGIKGTDVSKGAAEMILADDNFATIVTAVEEGRGIFDNIKKFVKFLLSANADTITEVLTAILMGLPLPFLPVHILWMNLVTDGFPALALSVDPKDKDVMERKPRDPNKSLLSEVGLFALAAGVIDAIASIILYLVALSYEGYFVNPAPYALSKARTMAISSAIIYELFFVFNCRDDDKSVWERGFKENFLSNKKLTIAVVISLTLQLMVIYLPFLQAIFKTTSLTFIELGMVFLFASTGLLILPRWFHKELRFKRKE
ncbi:HAD-IC family P-type ATPase [archaeon]|nr:HAD-IC family P-type ATPase [archaeon]